MLRHGEAGNRQKMMAADAKRALTAAGREEIAEVAKGMARLKINPDYVLTSPLVRARETADIVAKIQKSAGVEEWGELKPEGSRKEFYERLSKLRSGSTVLVVGHEPYLSTMILEIMGSPNGQLVLKKGGLARVRVSAFAPKIRGELRWLLSPGLMKKI